MMPFHNAFGPTMERLFRVGIYHEVALVCEVVMLDTNIHNTPCIHTYIVHDVFVQTWVLIVERLVIELNVMQFF